MSFRNVVRLGKAWAIDDEYNKEKAFQTAALPNTLPAFPLRTDAPQLTQLGNSWWEWSHPHL